MEGAGNDFIVLRPEYYALIDDPRQIQKLCDRHKGIGADGLISVKAPDDLSYDFQMIYHNADGSSSCFCGNGARCAVAFACDFFNLQKNITFRAYDGQHQAIVHDLEDIEISLRPTSTPNRIEDGYFVDTGSRHFCLQVDHLDQIDVFSEGRRWRHHEIFKPQGVNVNFWTRHENGIRMRTFEKGVEAETLACGTGVVAVALSLHTSQKASQATLSTSVEMKGGEFQVRARRLHAEGYEHIFLRGPVRQVFSGEILL